MAAGVAAGNTTMAAGEAAAKAGGGAAVLTGASGNNPLSTAFGLAYAGAGAIYGALGFLYKAFWTGAAYLGGC
jgi:hypothetical protein